MSDNIKLKDIEGEDTEMKKFLINLPVDYIEDLRKISKFRKMKGYSVLAAKLIMDAVDVARENGIVDNKKFF